MDGNRSHGSSTVGKAAPPAAVLFDFSGTLFDDTGVVSASALAAAACRRGQTLDPSAAAKTTRLLLEQASSPEGRRARVGSDLSPKVHREVWTGLAASTEGVSHAVAEAFYDCIVDTERWHPYPDTLPTLADLRRAGVSIAIVSNTGWDIRGSFVHARMYDLIDAFVLSCEHALEKPDPAIFRLACSSLGVEPGRTLMVGDDPTTDGLAVNAGLATYLLAPQRRAGQPRGLHNVLTLCGLAPRPGPFESIEASREPDGLARKEITAS